MLVILYSVEKFFISNFISNLNLELQPIIRLRKPCTLNQLFEQTLLEEQSIK